MPIAIGTGKQLINGFSRNIVTTNQTHNIRCVWIGSEKKKKKSNFFVEDKKENFQMIF